MFPTSTTAPYRPCESCARPPTPPPPPPTTPPPSVQPGSGSLNVDKDFDSTMLQAGSGHCSARCGEEVEDVRTGHFPFDSNIFNLGLSSFISFPRFSSPLFSNIFLLVSRWLTAYRFFLPPIAHVDQSSKICIPWVPGKSGALQTNLEKLAKNRERCDNEKCFANAVFVENLRG